MSTPQIQLPQPQLNAIKWVADRRNGDASLVTPDTLRALEENGFITFKNLVKSDPWPYPADGIDPAKARVPFLNAKAWEISGRPRREGIVRIVFKSDRPDDDSKRCEIEIAPCHPGVQVRSVGFDTSTVEIPDRGVPDGGHMRWSWDVAGMQEGMELVVLLTFVAAMKSGHRGLVIDDQTIWWNGLKADIERGADVGIAVRGLFRALGLDESVVPDAFPGKAPVKTRSLEFA